MYKNEKIFQFFANLILALLTICCVAPFLLMISASFSSESALSVYGYTFWPKEFDLSAYKYLFSSTGALLKAYSVSIGVTVVGTDHDNFDVISVIQKRSSGQKYICFLSLFHNAV